MLVLVENLGMNYLISVRVNSSQAETIILRALLPTDQSWSNEQITLALPKQSVHWFDVHSGDVISKQPMLSKLV